MFLSILWVKDQYLLAQHFKNKLQEHVHVYKKSLEGNNEGFAAPFHTDNGILLMVTPFQVTFFWSNLVDICACSGAPTANKEPRR